jgi:predicted amidohydrolase
MRIALGQINTTVGDLTGNVDRMVQYARRAAAGGAGLVVFPELSVTGYPPRDLVEKPTFTERSEQQLERLAAETAESDIAVICGYVEGFHGQAGNESRSRPARRRNPFPPDEDSAAHLRRVR